VVRRTCLIVWGGGVGGGGGGGGGFGGGGGGFRDAKLPVEEDRPSGLVTKSSKKKNSRPGCMIFRKFNRKLRGWGEGKTRGSISRQSANYLILPRVRGANCYSRREKRVLCEY